MVPVTSWINSSANILTKEFMSIRKEIYDGVLFIILINDMAECLHVKRDLERYSENNSSFNMCTFQVPILGFKINCTK